MSRIPAGVLIWSLKRYTRDGNLWDRTCFRCKQRTPVFEYEHRDERELPLFNYLCEGCAQKKLAEWLQCEASPDYVHLGYQTDFDIATVFYEQKNDEETLTLTRWSPEQRRRRLQGREK
jgi:glycerol-3-phosphate cytidylyltransferase-like family protein